MKVNLSRITCRLGAQVCIEIGHDPLFINSMLLVFTNPDSPEDAKGLVEEIRDAGELFGLLEIEIAPILALLKNRGFHLYDVKTLGINTVPVQTPTQPLRPGTSEPFPWGKPYIGTPEPWISPTIPFDPWAPTTPCVSIAKTPSTKYWREFSENAGGTVAKDVFYVVGEH